MNRDWPPRVGDNVVVRSTGETRRVKEIDWSETGPIYSCVSEESVHYVDRSRRHLAPPAGAEEESFVNQFRINELAPAQ